MPASRDLVASYPAAPGRLTVFLGAPGAPATAPLLAGVRRDLDEIPVASRENLTLVVFGDRDTAEPLLTQALGLGDPERAYVASGVRGLGAGPGHRRRAMEVIWALGTLQDDGQPGGGQPRGHDGDSDDASPPPAPPRPGRQVQWPGSGDQGTGTGEAAGREPGSSPPTDESRPPPASEAASDTPWGERVSRPSRGPHDEPPGISTQRFGGLHAVLRLRVLRYLGGQPADQYRINLLADVLGEAEGWAEGATDEAWNRRISEGLALLPSTGIDSYAAMVPGIDDHAALAVGSLVTANDLIRTHASQESVTSDDVLYVIVGTEGRDVSGLVGQGSDLVMFDRGQHFEVARIGREAGGRLEIELRHRAGRASGPDAEPVAAISAAAATLLPEPPPPTAGEEVREAEGGAVQRVLPGGAVSITRAYVAQVPWIFRWMEGRRPFPGLFDLVQEARADGLYESRSDGSAVLVDGHQVAQTLALFGVAHDDIVSVLVPGGERFAGQLAALASSRLGPVLTPPVNADLRENPFIEDGEEGIDLFVADARTGEFVPWRVFWPSGSWEDVHGRVMVEDAVVFPGMFVVGLYAGPAGLWLLHDGGTRGIVGKRTGIGRDELRDLGWRRGQAVVVVTRRQAGDGLEQLVEDLSDELGADIWYPSAEARLEATSGYLLRTVAASGEPADLWARQESRSPRDSGINVPAWFRVTDGALVLDEGISGFGFVQGFASAGPAEFLSRLDLLRRQPDPAVFDLVLQRDEWGRLGFASYAGGFVLPASWENLRVPQGMHDVRLVMDDGEQAWEAAAGLADALRLPVWVTPAGAVAGVSDTGRLIARDRETGRPVSWVQVIPAGRPAVGLPWYDTASGEFRTRRGEAVVEFTRAGKVYGIRPAAHWEHVSVRVRAYLPAPVPDGMYVAALDIVSGDSGPEFSLPDLGGSVASSRPLGELRWLLERHGWTDGQAIVVAADFRAYAGDDADQRWAALADGLAGVARSTGASLFFPARGSYAEYLDGRLAVRGGGDARWIRVDPLPRQGLAAPELAQDPAGQLRLRSDTGFVSLPVVAGRGAGLRAGVASPTAEMMRARSWDYWLASGANAGVFFVDVPLTGEGRIGLVVPGDAEAGTGSEAPAGAGRAVELSGQLAPAGTDQVVGLIRGAGYDEGLQVIQFLAAPRTDEEHAVFAEEARRVADRIGRDVYIVGAAGVTVAYDGAQRIFVAEANGVTVPWRVVRTRDGGGEAAEQSVEGSVWPPDQRFSPELVNRELAGFAVEQELTGEQARAALGGSPDAGLARLLAVLPAAERVRARSWLERTRMAAGWAERALRYLSGDPEYALDAGQQRELAVALVTGLASRAERGLALVLLQAADDSELAVMFGGEDGRGLLTALDAGIRPGDVLRGDLDRFFEQRFDGGRPALAEDPVVARGQPAGVLIPRLVSAELPPVQRARAQWWLGRARAEAGWADQAIGHLSGDPAHALDARRQRVVAAALVTGLASQEEQGLALHLLQSADDAELAEIFSGGGDRGLLAALNAGIRPGDVLREELDRFFEQRFHGGRAALEAGTVQPSRYYPALTFTPAMLDESLAGLGVSAELTLDATGRVVEAIGQWSEPLIAHVADEMLMDGLTELSGALLGLPPVQRARAAWWLTGLWLAVYANHTSPSHVRQILDYILGTLYGAAAQVADDTRLRQVTLRPPRELAPNLRTVRPSSEREVVQEEARTERFIDQLSGQTENFGAKLDRAYRTDLERYRQQLVVGKGAAERAVPYGLYSMEHIARIAAIAKEWTDEVFGHLATRPALVPDRPGLPGQIHDHWVNFDLRVRSMSPDEGRIWARASLLRFLTWPTAVARVIREHHASFDPHGAPSQDTLIIGTVIDRLLDDRTIVEQVLRIERGWPAQANPLSNEIWLQVLREPVPILDQYALWRIAGDDVHEGLHLLENPRYQRYRNSLGLGSFAYNTLAEGVVCLLSEIVWSRVWPRAGDAAVRRVIEGRHADRPPLPLTELPRPGRYASMTEVVRLLQVVGRVENLYAAFFLGEVEKLTGPISLAVMGSPRAPLSAGEVAALVARLNAMPDAERRRLRISLFADATPQEVERLLTERGADVLLLWTDFAAEPGSLGSGAPEVGWADQARAYLSGDRAARLGPAGLRALVVGLLRLASDDARLLVLDLLGAVSDDDLRAMADPAVAGTAYQERPLADELNEAIPDDHRLHDALEYVLYERFREGWDGLAAGEVRRVRPGQAFTPALLHLDRTDAIPDDDLEGPARQFDLRDLTVNADLDQEALNRIEMALRYWDGEPLAQYLRSLPPLEQIAAARWLTAVRMALDPGAGLRRPVLRQLDAILDELYSGATYELVDQGQLTGRAALPSPETRAELRRALGLEESFTSRRAWNAQEFRHELRAAYEGEILADTRRYVTGRGPENRGPDHLYPMGDILEIAELANRYVARLFGHRGIPLELTLAAGAPGIVRIHDLWDHEDLEQHGMSPGELLSVARGHLIGYLTQGDRVTGVVREFGSTPRWGLDGTPLDEAARVIESVIADVLSADQTVEAVLGILRCWPSRADPGTRQIWVQRFRPAAPWRDRQTRWEIFDALNRAFIGMRLHPDLRDYSRSLGRWTYAGNALHDGVTEWLAGLLWRAIPVHRPEVFTVVEGQLALEQPLRPELMPHRPADRHPSVVAVLELLNQVGPHNVLAAVFAGLLPMIGGPASLAGTDSPSALPPAGEAEDAQVAVGSPWLVLAPPDPRIQVARRVAEVLPWFGWTGELPSQTQILDQLRLLARDPANRQHPAEVIVGLVARAMRLQQPSTDPAGEEQTLDQRSDLIARVRRNLRDLGWPGDPADAEIEDLYVRLTNDPAAGRGTAALANSIALSIANRGSLDPMKGGGSGIEAEFPYLTTISGHELDELLAESAVLAYGPGRMFSITVDEDVCFLGGDGRYYRTRAGAESAPGGTARAVIAILEFVSNVTRTFPAESGYVRHEAVFAALARLEQVLAGLPGEEGSPPGIALSEVLRPEDGFELTELGRGSLIGPRPVGDRPGANVQYTFGVPLTGLYSFLEHVLDHTRADEKGFLRRVHLADGLEFGTQVAVRFLMERDFPDGDLPPGLSAEDELARRSVSELAVAQLRGYAALLYTGAATVAHSFIYEGLNKDNAAVLARHDIGQNLAALPPEVRDYLKRNADDIMNRFERSFRNRIPDYDDRFRERWVDPEERHRPVTIDLLRPPVDWEWAHYGLPRSPANYLLDGLDPARAVGIPQSIYVGVTTLPGLDTEHQEELGFELVVLEVRAYGARPVSAAVARANHERLAAVVRELGVRDQEIALAASVRRVIGEGLARHPAILRLRDAAPLVMRHARPGVIWAAALDFLRADPAAVSGIRFVEDAWQDGQRWTLVPLPAGVRGLLGVGGPTVIRGDGRAGRVAHAGPGQVPGSVAVEFPEGRSGQEDVPGSLELAALARWLAEAGAGAVPDPGSARGGRLPEVQVTGFGNGRRFDLTDESARRTGQRRAGAVWSRLLAGVREYLGQLGADPAIAGSLLPAGLVTGAPRPAGVTRAQGRQAVATVRASSSTPADPPAAVEEARGAASEPAPIAGHVVPTPSGFYFPGPEGDQDGRAAAFWFPRVGGATVVHVHSDPATGGFVVRDQVLTAERFAAEFGERLGLAAGDLLIVVACRGAELAALLADRAGRPVLATTDADAWTTPDGRVVAAQAAVDEQGRPVLVPGAWVLTVPGREPPVRLGTELLAILRGGVLPEDLVPGARRLRVAEDGGRPRPARNVRWAQPGGSGPEWGVPGPDRAQDRVVDRSPLARDVTWLSDDGGVAAAQMTGGHPAPGDPAGPGLDLTALQLGTRVALVLFAAGEGTAEQVTRLHSAFYGGAVRAGSLAGYAEVTGASWTRARVGAVMWDLVRLGPGSTAFVAGGLSAGSARVSALRNEEGGIYRIDLPAGTVTPARTSGDGTADVVVYDSSGRPQPPSAGSQVPGWWLTGGAGVSLIRHSWVLRDPAGPSVRVGTWRTRHGSCRVLGQLRPGTRAGWERAVGR